jgi:2Fe-2S ferredoxin
MGTIIIANMESKTIDWPDKKERLLDILLAQGDWMHACGGKGRCTTCRIKVIEGMNQLNEHTPAEQKFISANRLKKDERLSCQVVPTGNITICVPKDCQLPHLTYSGTCL